MEHRNQVSQIVFLQQLNDTRSVVILTMHRLSNGGMCDPVAGEHRIHHLPGHVVCLNHVEQEITNVI